MSTKTPKEKKRESNSLSRYFKDLNESDLDSDESENDSTEEPAKSLQNDTNNKADNEKKIDPGESLQPTIQIPKQSKSPSDAPVKLQKLPSAQECLNTKSSPTFLKMNQKKEINWDNSHKKLDGENDEGILDYKSNAVPPPSSYDPVTDPGIKVVDSDGKKRKSSAEVPEDQTVSSKKAYRIERQDQLEQQQEDS